MHVCPKKGLVPELPPFQDMLCDEKEWLARLSSIYYLIEDLWTKTIIIVDDMPEDKANQHLKDMADGLQDPFGEKNGKIFKRLKSDIEAKYGLAKDDKERLYVKEIRKIKEKKREHMTVEEKKKHDLWGWFNEIVWNVEKVRMLKNEPSYTEPKDYSKDCLDWAEEAEAQWLFPSRKRKRESNEILP